MAELNRSSATPGNITAIRDEISIAFFSRGRGRGHVVLDLDLTSEICNTDPSVRIHWISYGTGASVLGTAGYPLTDLRLPDENPFLETQLRSIRVLERLHPDLVLAHEEYAAVPAAHLLGIPAIFITDYFLPSRHIWMQSLQYAEQILFLDESGYFEPPSFVKTKVCYAGTFVRTLRHTRAERFRTRVELGIATNALFLLVLPGSWFTEQRAPIFDVVTAAFATLENRNKLLVWFAASDYSEVSARAVGHSDILVRPNDPNIDAWMSACDLAITKGTRKTSLELASLGVPAIAISPGQNPIDDIRVRRIPSSLYVPSRGLDAMTLASLMRKCLDDCDQPLVSNPLPSSGVSVAVDKLIEIINQIRERKTIRH